MTHDVGDIFRRVAEAIVPQVRHTIIVDNGSREPTRKPTTTKPEPPKPRREIEAEKPQPRVSIPIPSFDEEEEQDGERGLSADLLFEGYRDPVQSREGTERLVRKAIQYAIANQRKSVTLVHKGNIQKFTEGGFRDWGYRLAQKEFGGKLV